MKPVASNICSHYTLQALLLSQYRSQSRKTCLYVCHHKRRKLLMQFHTPKNFGKERCVYRDTHIRYCHCNLKYTCVYHDTDMTARVQLLSLSMFLSDTTITVYIVDVNCDDHVTGQLC